MWDNVNAEIAERHALEDEWLAIQRDEARASPPAELHRGDLVRRKDGDIYQRAERGRIIWVRQNGASQRCCVEWYKAMGGTTRAAITAARLVKVE